MKRILIIIICIFSLCACTTKKEETTKSDNQEDVVNQQENQTDETDNNIENVKDVDAPIDLSKAIIGEWYVITGEYGNQVLTFSDDGSYKEVNDLIDKTETKTGTYKINNNKLSIYYKTSSGSLVNDENLNFEIYNNVLRIDDLGGLYCKMGEAPDTTNEYTKQLNGYYTNNNGEYYYFKDNGELEYTSKYGTTFYYYVADENGFTSDIPMGSSSGKINGNFKLDSSNNIIAIKDVAMCANGQASSTITEISYKEYYDAVGDLPEIHILLVIADALKVRSSPSLSGEKTGVYFKGRIITSNSSFKTMQNDGYTWYKIYENAYIADQNGQWVKIIK